MNGTLTPEQRQAIYEKLLEKKKKENPYTSPEFVGGASKAIGQIASGLTGMPNMVDSDSLRGIAAGARERDRLEDMSRKDRLKTLLKLDDDSRRRNKEDKTFGMKVDEYERKKAADEAAGIANSQSMKANWNLHSKRLADLGFDTSSLTGREDPKQLQQLADRLDKQKAENNKQPKSSVINMPDNTQFQARDESSAKKAIESVSRMEGIKRNLKLLRERIKEHGTGEMTSYFDNENEMLDQLVEDIAIDYAKIKDPDSVARESEVAAAKRLLIEPGFWQLESSVMEKLDSFENIVENQYKDRMKMYGNPKQSQSNPEDKAFEGIGSKFKSRFD